MNQVKSKKEKGKDATKSQRNTKKIKLQINIDKMNKVKRIK
ncbi:MAG: hypothetical protein U9N34_09140 [Candidatus Cloacimonadota bacterium]|nr:hypothetical protein [Candidatus Cloacimonadota bacterium]